MENPSINIRKPTGLIICPAIHGNDLTSAGKNKNTELTATRKKPTVIAPICFFLSLMYSDRYITDRRDDKNAVGIQSENLVLKKSAIILLDKNSTVNRTKISKGCIF